MARAKVLACAALVLTVAASLILLQPYVTRRWLAMPKMPCSLKSSNDAYQADLHLLSQLGASPTLIQLTGTQESAVEVLKNLRSYHAPVVVTAGRGGPTRRTEDQPFISLDPDHTLSSNPLTSLSGPVALANSAVVAVEQVLGRRLFPITIGLFERAGSSSNGGPYAIFDASAGTLLLERGFVSYTRAADSTTVSYITSQLAHGVFEQAAAVLSRIGRSVADSPTGTTTAAADGTYDITAAAAATAAFTTAADDDDDDDSNSGDGGVSNADDVDGLDWERQNIAAAVSAATSNTNPNGSDTVSPKSATDVEITLAQAATSLPHPVRQLLAAASNAGKTLTAVTDSGTGAGFALQVLTAAVGAAIPAAFAAAPPLWFCILCPSVLGLVAPIAINLALNQLAGVLCSQLHLDDNACFDMILGALGLGFVLSLASAIPIFFVCQLPQCAGRNVTGALRALRWN